MSAHTSNTSWQEEESAENPYSKQLFVSYTLADSSQSITPNQKVPLTRQQHCGRAKFASRR